MDTETKNHVHTQSHPYRYEARTYAPDKNSDGRGRFSVEVSQYVPASGWDEINPMVSGNQVIVGFLHFVQMYEMMGYKHVGLASREIERMMDNVWSK